jgi:RNA polymerase sigma factor (sigma-70 family)
MHEVTQLLKAIEQGQHQAAEALLPVVYDELRKLARQKLRHEQPGHTLEATALVHEAYLRLVGTHREGEAPAAPSNLRPPTSDLGPLPSDCGPRASGTFDSRNHFFAAAAEAMRRILVDSARRKNRLKRGGDRERDPLDDDCIAAPEIDSDLLELDAALEKLAAKDPRKAQLVKLRYFAGLTIEQAAQALDISTTTADRDWTYAKAWLYREISKGNT